MEKHSHMLSGTDENETTLRLLYYPPLVEDDNQCEELVKKNLSYSYQRCASHELHLEKIVDDEPDAAALPSPSAEDAMKKHRGVTRCGAHCDYGTFTLLAQDSEGGLECKLPNSDKWKPVGHLPGSILINTGELLSMWTNDKFPALPHRVTIPEQPTVRNKGRHAMAFFVHPDNDTEIIPLDSLATVSLSAEQSNGNGTAILKKKKSFHNK